MTRCGFQRFTVRVSITKSNPIPDAMFVLIHVTIPIQIPRALPNPVMVRAPVTTPVPLSILRRRRRVYIPLPISGQIRGMHCRRRRCERIGKVRVESIRLVYPPRDLGLRSEVGLVCLWGKVVLGHLDKSTESDK